MHAKELRLDNDALRQALHSDSADQRRSRVLAALAMAESSSGIVAPELDEAKVVLTDGKHAAPDLVERVSQLTERLDDAYFDAQDEGKEQESALLFRQARTAAAFGFAITSTEQEMACEAIYEAAHATEDPQATYAKLLTA